MMYGGETEHGDWPLRPWFLAVGLGLAGLLVWAFSHDSTQVPWRMAASAFVFFGAIAAAFTVERDRWKEPALFALTAGFVMAGLTWRAVSAGDHYADPQFGFAAGVIATGLALPLFQAGFLKTRFATPYERVHYHVWSDAIAAAGSMAFVAAAWVLLVVLSELFHLLKIDFLRHLAEHEWFGWTYSATAFGAALGTLRNQMKILATLQAVAMTVLSILAVPLALGLALFLVAMAVSGPDVLWQATRSATPVLLTCAAGAWVLANAILRDSDGAMTGNRVLRWAARALALVILPLTVFAAVSLGTRVAQHGLSPERLWGLIAIAVACAYGLAWLVAMIRGGKAGWGDRLRQANLHLAAAICVVAFLLSLPILDFGRISAGNQIHRLESGQVAPEDFDYSALRWDFGDAGREALARLAKNSDKSIAESARTELLSKERELAFPGNEASPAVRRANMRVQSSDPYWEKRIRQHFLDMNWYCNSPCVAIDLGSDATGRRRIKIVENYIVQDFILDPEPGQAKPGEFTENEPKRVNADHMSTNANVEVRDWNGRRIYVDGQPIGDPFK